MELFITPHGQVHCVYDEVIDLHRLGTLTIERASHVEPAPDGRWWADLSPVNGPKLGPFHLRTFALKAEQEWLATHWLPQAGVVPGG